MSRLLSFLILFTAVDPFAYSNASERQKKADLKFYGVVVEFQEKAKSEFAYRDRLHAKLRTRLKHRLKLVDAVVPLSKRRAGDEVYLYELCDAYKKSRLVSTCKPNLLLNTHQEECPQCKSVDQVLRKVIEEGCELIPFMGKGEVEPFDLYGEAKTLTPLWAQEYIGADLAKDFLDQLKNSEGVPVAAIDSGFGARPFTGILAKELVDERVEGNQEAVVSHGLKSIEIMSGKTPFGVGARSYIVALAKVNVESEIQPAAEAIVSAKTKPKIVNMSISRGRSPESADALKSMARQTILVGAAGNGYPFPIETNGVKYDMLLVGNLCANGLICSSSKEGSEVAVVAPAGSSVRNEAFESLWKLGADGVDFMIKNSSVVDSYVLCRASKGLAFGGPSIWQRAVRAEVPEDIRSCFIKALAFSCEMDWNECFGHIKMATHDVSEKVREASGRSIFELWRSAIDIRRFGKEGIDAVRLYGSKSKSVRDVKLIERLISESQPDDAG